jgi:D-alanyl-D-alanine carboxypeptidase (penicillin-binding protein 5/6)
MARCYVLHATCSHNTPNQLSSPPKTAQGWQAIATAVQRFLVSNFTDKSFNMNTVKLILLILLPIWLSLVTEVSYGGHRHAAILIDADNGKVLHEVDAHHAWFPASLTKVMTLYMTFTALNQGYVQLNDSMVASPHAARQPNSKLGLRTGESITVEEAILALVTRSANDAAVVLAEHLGGNEENFAARMTAKAHALGMYDTHFMNATGLPHPWQVTTARDLGLLAWKTRRDFPNFYPYFGAHSFYFRGREWPGINKFTANYPGAEGMKTGFTCGSGYNLISSAQQNGKRLIGVVMGGMTSPERYQLMTAMMDGGFANRLAAYPEKHITAGTFKYASVAPYQLGCGRVNTYTHLAATQYRPTASSYHPNRYNAKLRLKATHRLASRPHKSTVSGKAHIAHLSKKIAKPNKARYHRNR